MCCASPEHTTHPPPSWWISHTTRAPRSPSHGVCVQPHPPPVADGWSGTSCRPPPRVLKQLRPPSPDGIWSFAFDRQRRPQLSVSPPADGRPVRAADPLPTPLPHELRTGPPRAAASEARPGFGFTRAHHHHHPGRGDLRFLQRPWLVGSALGPTRPRSCVPSGSLGSSARRRLWTPTLSAL
ncbi:formin-like protein 20 [Hordeum vulgare subsp. vulgare]|uniref:Predicted protein n=1 Tax=Hordeum vulgare subsp. vulgare TaxID=112509 RepID=F2DS89_HORVV|nr:formin-like protein 20 [Hordeum vulgare subsp. vulgare]BAJ97960.1 predicted protein [Hordeum vulgare subsp. vulgare]